MPKFIVDTVADATVTLRTPENNYRNTFQTSAAMPGPGQPVTGTIHAAAWKLDRVEAGGNYVEPLFGIPRRMQGMVVACRPETNELVVHVGYEVVVKLPPRYRAGDYPAGARVGWDNVETPTFQAGG